MYIEGGMRSNQRELSVSFDLTVSHCFSLQIKLSVKSFLDYIDLSLIFPAGLYLALKEI